MFNSSSLSSPRGIGLQRRDVIRIMADVFEQEQLAHLIQWLNADGHECAVFAGDDGLCAALTDPRTKLVLLGTATTELSCLTEQLRTLNGTHDIPVIVYLKGQVTDFNDDALPPDIDDFLIEPLNLHDVRLRVRRTVKPPNREEDELNQSRLNLISHFGMRQFIGTSPAFLSAINIIPRVAACDVTLLIVGDTGTGKEMCARATHYMSARAGKPMIPINCGSVPAELFENELFGHEQGAFTDARRAKRGLIAEAEGGTLFLDEVDSLPMAAQIKLLRFSQDQQYKPLGSSTYRQANVRLIAATNQDLKKKVAEGTFREDLYYRLNVVTLSLPPLAKRREDIIPLAAHFLKTSAAEYRRPALRFSQAAKQKLLSYTWPGNVRELENVIRYAVVLGEEPTIRAHDIKLFVGPLLPAAVSGALDEVTETASVREPFKIAKARIVSSFERNYLQAVLQDSAGNISQAARAAKKDRRAFFALLKKHGLTQLAEQ